MSLARTLDGLIDAIQFSIEEGDRWVQISPGTLAALKAPMRTPPAKPSAAPRPNPRPATARAEAEFAPPRAATPPPVSASDFAPSVTGTPELTAIAQRVAACTHCGLCKTRTRVVPGQGNPRPEVAFLGEGPGADEDEQGLAFVGASGQLLTRLIARMGFTRDDVWIGNVVKCRPPGNRVPEPDEMEACLPFLREQLALLKPNVVVCLGATAIRGLLNLNGITKLRGTWLSFEGIDLMPTFHPSYLLRGGGDEKARYWEVWEDMKLVLQRLGRPVPEQKPRAGG